MKSTSTAIPEHLDRNVSFWAPGSRIVLMLTALLVLVMPLTEYLWHFDNFLRGGQDLELGLFSVAMVGCLILVLLQHGRRGFSWILALRQQIPFRLQHLEDSVSGQRCDRISDLQELEAASRVLSQHTFPILV